MRIIKEVNEERIHKCSGCKSIFSYTGKDINHMFYDSVECPVCKKIESVSIFDKKVKEI